MKRWVNKVYQDDVLCRYNQNKGTLGEAQERLRKLTAEKDKVINDVQVGVAARATRGACKDCKGLGHMRTYGKKYDFQHTMPFGCGYILNGWSFCECIFSTK